MGLQRPQRLELARRDANDRITPFKAITEKNLRELPRPRMASRAD